MFLKNATTATEMSSFYLRSELIMLTSTFSRVKNIKKAKRRRCWFTRIFSCLLNHLFRLHCLRLLFCFFPTFFCSYCSSHTLLKLLNFLSLLCLSYCSSFAGFFRCTLILFLLNFDSFFAHFSLRSIFCFLLHSHVLFSCLCSRFDSRLVFCFFLLARDLVIHVFENILQFLKFCILLKQLELFNSSTDNFMKTFDFACLLLLIYFVHLAINERSQICSSVILLFLLLQIFVIIILKTFQVCLKFVYHPVNFENITVISLLYLDLNIFKRRRRFLCASSSFCFSIVFLVVLFFSVSAILAWRLFEYCFARILSLMSVHFLSYARRFFESFIVSYAFWSFIQEVNH